MISNLIISLQRQRVIHAAVENDYEINLMQRQRNPLVNTVPDNTGASTNGSEANEPCDVIMKGNECCGTLAASTTLVEAEDNEDKGRGQIDHQSENNLYLPVSHASALQMFLQK